MKLLIDPAQLEKHARLIEGIQSALPANLLDLAEQIKAMPLGRIAEAAQAVIETQKNRDT